MFLSDQILLRRVHEEAKAIHRSQVVESDPAEKEAQEDIEPETF